MKNVRTALFAFLFLMLVSVSAQAASTINWNTAIHYAKLAQIAEDVATTSDYAAADKAQIAALGYTYLQTLWGNDLGTEASPDVAVTVSYGFLAVSPSGELVAVIRGTDSILEWIDDAQFYFVSTPVANTHGYTEEGFSAIYKSLRIGSSTSSAKAVSSIQSYVASGTAKSVTVTGHSLGGALATLLARDVAANTTAKQLTVYTFASPRVGEDIFANGFNDNVTNSFRVYNSTDIVPDVPTWPYVHVNTGFELQSDSSKMKTGIACSHHLTTYLWLMGQAAGVNAGSLNAECVAN